MDWGAWNSLTKKNTADYRGISDEELNTYIHTVIMGRI